MDPVTVIGLISTVANLVQASTAAIAVIRDFKHGEREITSLSQDLAAFAEALTCFERVLRSRHIVYRVSSAVIEGVLQNSTQLIQELRTRMVQVSSSDLSTVRRARWVQHKASIARLHTQLVEKNAMLNTFLQIAHADVFLGLASQYPSFMLSEPLDQALEEKTNDEPFLLKAHQSSKHARHLSESSVQTLGSASTVSSVRPLSIAESSVTLVSVTSTDSLVLGSASNSEPGEKASSTGPKDSTNSNTDKRLSPPGMLAIRRACRYNCYCKCHDKAPAAPQRRFTGAKNRKSQCTDPTCRGIEVANEQIEAHSRFFRRALSHAMSAKSVQIRHDLKMYRMVPEGSDAMRFVKHGNLDRLKACVLSGEATIWDTAPDGWSLLHTATYNRQLPIVKYLMELGVETGVGDVGSRTPADLAVLKAIDQDAGEVEQEILDIFRRQNDVLADFDFTPIHKAVLRIYDATDAERPSLEELIKLVDDANNAPTTTNWAQWKTRFNGQSPLFADIIEYFRATAFEKPRGTKIICNLIDQKDMKYHWTPLHWAASSGHLDEMRSLVHLGADPTLLSNLNANILHAAAESKKGHGLAGALKIWKRCSDRLNINQANKWAESPLHVASWTSPACVKLLLQAGADPSVREENGQVPLHCAGLSERSNDRREIAVALCQAQGADHINRQDFDGRPPIFDFLDDPECIELLFRHGARLDLMDDSGKNILHHACVQGDSEVLASILKLSKQLGNELEIITAKSKHGNTPLMEAFSESRVECAMVLFTFDEVGDTLSHDGWAPVHYAATIGDAPLLEAVFRHPSFIRAMTTMDGKRADVLAMKAGNWHGRVKDLIREHDYMDWTD